MFQPDANDIALATALAAVRGHLKGQPPVRLGDWVQDVYHRLRTAVPESACIPQVSLASEVTEHLFTDPRLEASDAGRVGFARKIQFRQNSLRHFRHLTVSSTPEAAPPDAPWDADFVATEADHAAMVAEFRARG